MTLAAGTKLGRYEIRSKIGEGERAKFIWRMIPRYILSSLPLAQRETALSNWLR